MQRKLQQAASVFVVTDSDWATNPSVYAQAAKCVRSLREHGADPLHVVPPGDGQKKIGIGDFLASGGNPLDLIAVPSAPAEPPAGLRRMQRQVLERLLCQGTVGAVKVVEVARHLSVHRKTVYRTLKSLQDSGLLAIEYGDSVLVDDGSWRRKPHQFRLTEQLTGQLRHFEIAAGRSVVSKDSSVV